MSGKPPPGISSAARAAVRDFLASCSAAFAALIFACRVALSLEGLAVFCFGCVLAAAAGDFFELVVNVSAARFGAVAGGINVPNASKPGGSMSAARFVSKRDLEERRDGEHGDVASHKPSKAATNSRVPCGPVSSRVNCPSSGST